MNRAVLISVRPEWAAKIATGEKTVEIRKTRPKLKTPFKCYIYETQGKSDTPWIDEDGHMIFRGCGKVVAEFTCTAIDEIKPTNDPYGIYDIDDDYVRETCLVDGAMWDYGNGQTLYGWNIAKLEIYDTPKELTEFHTRRKCRSCIKSGYESGACTYDESCMVPAVITKAPQSWCYVEGLGNG